MKWDTTLWDCAPPERAWPFYSIRWQAAIGGRIYQGLQFLDDLEGLSTSLVERTLWGMIADMDKIFTAVCEEGKAR